MFILIPNLPLILPAFFNLEKNRNFRFASYLIKCEQSVVLNLAGIKEGVWVALILLAGAELFVKGILGEAESSKVSQYLCLCW